MTKGYCSDGSTPEQDSEKLEPKIPKKISVDMIYTRDPAISITDINTEGGNEYVKVDTHFNIVKFVVC